ncbi:MAG: nucleotidyltransferase domain-containing protein [Thermomicrobia bacterium]|nr:nucleotidyltransferase domain-containing protein [Thermomicrobia bacterium]
MRARRGRVQQSRCAAPSPPRIPHEERRWRQRCRQSSPNSARCSKDARPRLKRLVLFGSQARGAAEPGSDIDVLVVLAGPVDTVEEWNRIGDMLYDLMCAHECILIRCIFMDEERFTIRNDPLLRNIRREGIAV